MVRIEKVDARITALILEDIRTCYLIRAEKNILIDSGVPSDAQDIFSGLEKLSLHPKDIDLLYDVEDLKVDFALLDISRAEELQVVKDKRSVNHEGEAEIIRFIGTKL